MISNETALHPVFSPNWYPMFLPLGKYRGWSMTLNHAKNGKYYLEVFNVRDFTRIHSKPRTFTPEQKEEAIAYGKALIDWDIQFNPVIPEFSELAF